MKLYELTARYSALLEEADSESISPEAFRDTLDSIWDAMTVKAENTAKMVLNIDAEIEVLRREEKRLVDRRRGMENKKERLKDYLKNQMENAGFEKVRTPLFTISVQSNPLKLEITDEKQIPEEWWIVEKSLDRRMMAESLKEGKEIPGAQLIQTKSLRIR